ncbi:uncharacterized protein [Palaemon carinicauda]|uniref:uncharacterized protein n=1 Tax=Palaemon carinicauda TaxID=392227 RepID=UPI0035B58899
MRFVGALALVVVLAAVAETRPPREKRGIKICSARDVKFMATFVCNLHKRSVRSVDLEEEDFALPVSDDDLAMLGFLGSVPGSVPGRPLCGDNGRDCGRQVKVANITNSQLNYLQAWLAENGLVPSFPNERNQPRMTENHRPLHRNIEYGLQRETPRALLEDLFPSLKGPVAKRDKEIDWPLVPSMTLGDIRKNCCVRQCRMEDFYGACT